MLILWQAVQKRLAVLGLDPDDKGVVEFLQSGSLYSGNSDILGMLITC
jgi:hypothetical protein